MRFDLSFKVGFQKKGGDGEERGMGQGVHSAGRTFCKKMTKFLGPIGRVRGHGGGEKDYGFGFRSVFLRAV